MCEQVTWGETGIILFDFSFGLADKRMSPMCELGSIFVLAIHWQFTFINVYIHGNTFFFHYVNYTSSHSLFKWYFPASKSCSLVFLLKQENAHVHQFLRAFLFTDVYLSI